MSDSVLPVWLGRMRLLGDPRHIERDAGARYRPMSLECGGAAVRLRGDPRAVSAPRSATSVDESDAQMPPHVAPEVAFVLVGGEPHGAVEVGMIEALAEHDAVPDAIRGTSIGARDGVLLAVAPSHAIERLTSPWLDVEQGESFEAPRASRSRPSRAHGRTVTAPARSEAC